MRSWLPCARDGSPAAAARFGGFFSGTTSASKKTLRAAEQERADVARARRRWMRDQRMFELARLVFMTRPPPQPIWCEFAVAAREACDRPRAPWTLEEAHLR